MIVQLTLLKIYMDKNLQFEIDPTDPPAIKKSKHKQVSNLVNKFITYVSSTADR
jgi:hypothetical protein